MSDLSGRVSRFSNSVIRRMTSISNEYGAINLSQGFPDNDPPREVLDRLAQVAYEGPHQYPLSHGAPNFRAALARKASKTLKREVDPETEVVVTCGGTEAMVCTMMTLCDPGDKVMVFSPFYENYLADAILAGAEPIYIPLTGPDFSFDPARVEEGFRSGAKAIIVCNPSNPCGKVFTEEELKTIGALAVKYDAYVVTDEVYEHMVYAPSHHTAMASLPGMFERTVTCSSLSKTYSMTGWRLGYLVGPERIVSQAKKVHNYLTIGTSAPLQEAAVTALELPEQYYKDLLADYTHRRDSFMAGLDALGLKHNVPQGTYFLLLDISDFQALPQFAGKSDMEFCEWMIREVGVAAVPGSAFLRGEESHFVRLHFAKSEETRAEALRRLEKLAALLR